ncbi:sulfite exporter TauE/SafE family protein [Lederbergia galactosidilytica]|uniref:Probable membrane transporter protein n=1 Tax=Lederbergia galactosidilytica TaxID=217031 RepID=A0A177ZVB0_9BACI|nr:sulfite exporter TauE/SafE family protein [Lederbergia galactosidilytica]OAK71429.1 membrane protein [Lederbergia galactosidilytica]
MVELIFVMLFIGLLLGFIGAGGSGFMIAILTVGFGYPIHLAMGTALAAMMFTSLSGTISHIRERNTDIISGLLIGIVGAVAAWFGAGIALSIPESVITWLTASMLALSSIALFLRLVLATGDSVPLKKKTIRYPLAVVSLGLITGFLSGTFGIGATPFIQLGLMLLLGLPMRLAAGTSMLIILPIAAAGGAGYYWADSLDVPLLLTVLAGTMTGSYLGAKLTKRAPQKLLKIGIIATPLAAALILFF